MESAPWFEGLWGWRGGRMVAGMKLRVRATPNARESAIMGWEEDSLVGRVLRVRVAAPPSEGKANAELRRFLAKSLGIPKSRVVLEKGSASRIKCFDIPDGASLS